MDPNTKISYSQKMRHQPVVKKINRQYEQCYRMEKSSDECDNFFYLLKYLTDKTPDGQKKLSQHIANSGK